MTVMRERDTTQHNTHAHDIYIYIYICEPEKEPDITIPGCDSDSCTGTNLRMFVFDGQSSVGWLACLLLGVQ